MVKFWHLLVCFSTLFISVADSNAQNVDTSLVRPNNQLIIGYSAGISGFDLNFKTDFIHQIDVSYYRKVSKKLDLGLEYNFLFGLFNQNLNQYSVFNYSGVVITNNGGISNVEAFFRGHSSHLLLSRILKQSKNHFFSAEIGFGILIHKIKFSLTSGEASFLNDENLINYDQLSTGPSTKQKLSYRYISDNKRINFSLALFATEALVKNRRTYNYLTQSKDDNWKSNLIYGISAGWIIPIGTHKKEIYYYQ